MTNLADAPAHPFDIAREIRRATELTNGLRAMGFSEAEIALRREEPRTWSFDRHPGPGMRRVLLRWPLGDVTESSVSVDSSWQWSTATILAFRAEDA